MSLAVCHGENGFPTFNSLFGCDFSLLEMPYPSPTLPLVANVHGVEIKRKIHKKINSGDDKCNTRVASDEIFTCFGKWMETRLSCKLPWSQNSLFPNKPCETFQQLNEYQSLLNPMRYGHFVDN